MPEPTTSATPNDTTARCGRRSAPMVERAAPTTGRRSVRRSVRRSWRCSAWPACRQTAKLPAYLEDRPDAEQPWWVTPCQP